VDNSTDLLLLLSANSRHMQSQSRRSQSHMKTMGLETSFCGLPVPLP
jgi:uncharacterized protein YjiK